MLKTLMAALLLIAIGTPAANAAWYDQCLLFRDKNFTGKMTILNEDQWVVNFKKLDGDWNDEVSSAQTKGKCVLYLYEKDTYRGWTWYVDNNGTRDLGDKNDEATSAKCICH